MPNLVSVRLVTKASTGGADEFITIELPRRAMQNPRMLKLVTLFVKTATGVDKYFYDVAVFDYDSKTNDPYPLITFTTKPHGADKEVNRPFWRDLSFRFYSTTATDLIGGYVVYEE